MGWSIRSAEPSDHDAIVGLVDEAFTSPGRDGGEEVDIVESTWRLAADVDGLELVAVEDGGVVGHVLGAGADLDGRSIVAVAPLSVTPSRQGGGIGSGLMIELLARAEARHWPLVALLGEPGFYGRFGFEASAPFGIHYPPAGEGSPNFLVHRLPGFDPSLRGEVRYCWEQPAG